MKKHLSDYNSPSMPYRLIEEDLFKSVKPGLSGKRFENESSFSDHNLCATGRILTFSNRNEFHKL